MALPVADLAASAVRNTWGTTLLKAIHDGRKKTAMGAWTFVFAEEETREGTAYVHRPGGVTNRDLPVTHGRGTG